MDQTKGYFPLFLDIRDKRILFIGGGTIAARRAEVLSGFACRPEVIAPKISDEMKKLLEKGDITWIQRAYIPEDLDRADILFLCTNDPHLNHDIWKVCKARQIPVNNCSNHEECDFYFPGIVTKSEIVIGVTAGGSDHKKAAQLRKEIAALLEENGNG